MAIAQTDFIFRTNHAFALLTADFCRLDGKGISLCGMNRCAWQCYYYFLASRNIRRATNNLRGLGCSNVNRSDRKFISVRMLDTSEDFTNDQTFEAAFYRFKRFNALYL